MKFSVLLQDSSVVESEMDDYINNNNNTVDYADMDDLYYEENEYQVATNN
jgi:hypothetical protein